MNPEAEFQPVIEQGENPPPLAVERISAEQFWAEKRVRQGHSYSRVAGGEIPQRALFAFSVEELRSAKLSWPKGGFSGLEDDDVEERGCSRLRE